MKIFCLFGQRIERYTGEYAPELLAATDEVSDGNNPDYMQEALDAYATTADFSKLQIITISINDQEFYRIFNPPKEITGVVIQTPGGDES